MNRAVSPEPSGGVDAQRRGRWLWLCLSFLYVLLLTRVSTAPAQHTNPSSAVLEALHNALHIPAYSVLTLFLVIALRRWRVRWAGFWAFGCAAVYGGWMEFLQSMVPGRMMSAGDEIRNMLGAGLALWAIRYVDRKWPGLLPGAAGLNNG